MSPAQTAAPGLVAVLAAGLATRFGGGKLAAACAGRPLGAWAAETALALGWPALAVVGPDGGGFWCDPAAAALERVTNPDPAQGLGSSLALAARAAQDRQVPLLLVTLADMPLVSRATLDRLVALAGIHGLAATRHPDGRSGVPACFAARHFAALAAASGEAGARDLLRTCPEAALVSPAAAELRDVDTAEDLAAVAALLAATDAGRPDRS